MKGPEPYGFLKKSSPWASTAFFGRIEPLNNARLFSIGVKGLPRLIFMVLASTTIYFVTGLKKRAQSDFSPAARCNEKTTSSAVTASPFANLASRRVNVIFSLQRAAGEKSDW